MQQFWVAFLVMLFTYVSGLVEVEFAPYGDTAVFDIVQFIVHLTICSGVNVWLKIMLMVLKGLILMRQQ